MNLNGYKFFKIGNIEFVLENKKIKEFFPENRYLKRKECLLHKYGASPFCGFKVNHKIKDNGVYCFKIENEIKYIGKSENLYKRIYAYGSIQPRNCYVGGQQTNCRINKLILREAKNNKKIELFFMKTHNKDDIEEELIKKYNPEWNKR